ncbi:hypothetical protein ACJW31_06G045400 [Castanea mollissima]
MSIPISGAPSQIAKSEVLRRTANSHPSIWGDRFINNTSRDKDIHSHKVHEVEELKEEVRRELFASASHLSQQLGLIDAIQRLGMAYNFETEIEKALEHIYATYDDNNDVDKDLYNVFNKFKDEDGQFKESLTSNIEGMLAFYEATHLRVHGEDILDEALNLSTTNLKSTTSLINNPLAAQITRALKQPLHKGIPRVEARQYISVYEQDASHNKDLLNLSKLDFNLVQSLHKEEVGYITRWDISSTDQLPDYMQICYCALLDVFEAADEELAKQGRSYRVSYTTDAMKLLVQAYFDEAKWFFQNYIPTMEEYMNLALRTSGYPMLTTVSFLGMGDIVTKQAFNWIFSTPKIITASSLIGRLMDDIRSHKRGHVASAIECYMKQHGVSEQVVHDKLNEQVVDAWKDINEECLRPTAFPMPLLMRVLNLTRVIDVFYKEGDDYTHVGKEMKENVALVPIDPVPI